MGPKKILQINSISRSISSSNSNVRSRSTVSSKSSRAKIAKEIKDKLDFNRIKQVLLSGKKLNEEESKIYERLLDKGNWMQ